ncbi:MAG: hypothetical protein KDA93_23935 [Planctomycetaceae bacterium]|nr:hypothetical protein [Planctomycetaceae bacterium]
MDFTPLARFIVTISGVLGLGIQARVLLSPKQWTNIAPIWEVASLTQKGLMLAVFAVPLCYYTFCIVTCYVRLSRPVLITSTGVIALAAIPYFLGIAEESPTIARNAGWTGVPWLFIFADQLAANRQRSVGVTSDTASDECADH